MIPQEKGADPARLARYSLAMPATASDIIKIIFAFILPPLGVALEVGLTKHFWINVLLTILGFWVGGVIHALWVILAK